MWGQKAGSHKVTKWKCVPIMCWRTKHTHTPQHKPKAAHALTHVEIPSLYTHVTHSSVDHRLSFSCRKHTHTHTPSCIHIFTHKHTCSTHVFTRTHSGRSDVVVSYMTDRRTRWFAGWTSRWRVKSTQPSIIYNNAQSEHFVLKAYRSNELQQSWSTQTKPLPVKKNLLMIHTGGNYIQVLTGRHCEWGVLCYYKWVCVGDPMVACIVVCIMILYAGAILEGNCFPFIFQTEGFFFFFWIFFHFPSQYRLSYLKITTWTTHLTSRKRPAARILLHFQAFYVHKVTFSHHLAPSFSTPISYTYWLCMCTIQIQTSRKKVQIWHTIDSPTCWGSF